jgi:Tol biopolymer transport system component
MDPQFSPDGKKIAYSTFTEIWTCDADGTDGNQLTNFQLMEKGSQCGSPRWSPDGSRIAFDHINQGKLGIYVVSAKGGLARCVTPEGVIAVLPSWSQDGQWVYFSSDQKGDWQVWKVPSGGGPAIQVTRHGGFEAFESADGQWLYYAKDHRYRGIWRVPVTGGEESQLLNRGRAQSWAITGAGIYLSEDEASGVAAVVLYSFATQRFTKLITIPKRLNIWRGSGNLAVSPDGGSILIMATEQVESDLVLVENFR